MTRPATRPARLALPLLALAALATAPAGAGHRDVPLDESDIFLELNDTDGDLGLHASIDGMPWTSLAITGPGESRLLDIVSHGRLLTQGLTQIDFESAEPSFDDLPPRRFFRRFPEGLYRIEARGQRGIRLTGEAELSHVLAAPPELVWVSGVPAAEDCDAVPLPKVSPPVVLAWTPVASSHPEIGRPGPVEVEQYQVFVERDAVGFSVTLPPTVTAFEVPAGVTTLGNAFKFEIIVRLANGNNTAVESCFEVW